MKTLAEFESLDAAKSYKTYVLEDADLMREYLQLQGKWGQVIRHTADFNSALHSAAAGLLHHVNRNNPLSFNPATTNGQAHIGMLDLFVNSGDITSDDKVWVINKATKQPYIDVTPEQYAEAKTLLANTIATLNYDVQYVHGENVLVDDVPDYSKSYHLTLGRKQIELFLVLDNPALHDTKFEIRMFSEVPKQPELTFVDDGQLLGELLVKKGQKAISKQFVGTFAHKVQFTSTANLNEPHKLVVSNVG